MTTAKPARAAPAAGLGVALLLATVLFINYVDRGSLATAAPLIKDQLKLSGSELGLLLSAFYWTYTPVQPLAGWVTERFNPYRTLAFGLALWSVATAVSGLAAGFTALLLLRLLVGLGESAAFPCISKVIAKDLPPERLGLANGLVGVGLALGPALGTYAGGHLMAHVGWRAVFVFFGVASLLWLAPWLLATRRLGGKASGGQDDAPAAPPFAAILRRREAWGVSLGHFSSNYGFYFVASWLPLYLVKAQGFSVGGMATLSGLIYLVYAASCLVSGQLSDLWTRAGASPTLVRKTLILSSHSLVALAMLGCSLGHARLSIACLFVAAVAFGLATANIFAISQILAGPNAAGKWVGFHNLWGNVPGILAPIVTGFVVDRTGGFEAAFAVACAVALLGLIGWGLMIPRVAPIDWSTPSGAPLPLTSPGVEMP